jgi:hypothetical protein
MKALLGETQHSWLCGVFCKKDDKSQPLILSLAMSYGTKSRANREAPVRQKLGATPPLSV